jgi:hypothetical protein
MGSKATRKAVMALFSNLTLTFGIKRYVTIFFEKFCETDKQGLK